MKARLPSFPCFYFPTLLFLLSAFSLNAQTRYQRRVDSLVAVVAAQKTGIPKAQSLIDLTNLYAKYNRIDKGKQSGRLALQQTRQLKWKQGECMALDALGNVYATIYSSSTPEKDLDSAFIYQRAANKLIGTIKDIKLKDRIKDNVTGTLFSLLGFSTDSYATLKYSESARRANKVLEQATFFKDSSYMVKAYMRLGDISTYLNDPATGRNYLMQAYNISSKKENKQQHLDVLLALDSHFTYVSDWVSDERYVLEAIKLSHELKRILPNLYLSMAGIYKKLNQFDKALGYADSAMQIATTQNNSVLKTYIIAHRAEIYLAAPDSFAKQKGIDLDEQYTIANNALNDDLKNGVNGYQKQITYMVLSRINERTKHYDKAYQYQKRYLEIRDSLLTVDKQRDFIRQNLNVGFAKTKDSLNFAKQLTDEQLKQQRLTVSQQQQQLLLNNQQLLLANNQKALDQLRFDKTQTDLRENAQRLQAAEQKQALSETTINLRDTELKAKRTQSYYMIGGIAALVLLSFFIAANYLNQRKSNRLLAAANEQVNLANAQLNEQQEEIITQRDKLADAIETLKVTQSQLIQTEKMASLGELTAGIAHEIQNPLNFVNNFSEVSVEMLEEMQDELDKGDVEEAKAIAADIIQNLSKINHHGKRADSIVKGMLEHSRSNTGQKTAVDLNKLAAECINLAYHGLRAKDKSFNSAIVTKFDDKLPQVNAAQQDISRVLLNLCSNALYSVQQKQRLGIAGYQPSVEVSTSVSENSVSVAVKDNGTGIPDEIRDKIMQPFFTTKPTGQGTGLGLSLSYDIIVKGHNGAINVDSTDGEGATFTITLPC